MPDGEYILISTGGVSYGIPVRPPVPAYAGAAAIIAAVQENYNRDVAAFIDHRDLSNHIKKLLLDAVPLDYLDELAHPDFGFSNVTPKQMLDHLVATYGGITPKDLQDNLQQIKAPWNPDTPIETVFRNGTFCRTFAAEGNDPISDTAYVRILVEIFEASGVLEKTVEDWERQPLADQTLANAIIHFKAGNKFRLIKEAKTAKNALEAHQAFTKTVADDSKAAPKSVGLDGWHYCHTHGICKHPGTNCPAPKEGHKKEATMSNRMGGKNNLMSRRPRNPRNNQENETPNNNNA